MDLSIKDKIVFYTVSNTELKISNYFEIDSKFLKSKIDLGYKSPFLIHFINFVFNLYCLIETGIIENETENFNYLLSENKLDLNQIFKVFLNNIYIKI